MLLYGDFQPHMRTQYSPNITSIFERELARDIVLQLGYVGSQGHRLLASHDINAANPQTCLDIIAVANNDSTQCVLLRFAWSSCGPFLEDNQFSVILPATNSLNLLPNGFHLPTGGTVAAAGQTLNFVGLRPYSSPNCNPPRRHWMSGRRCSSFHQYFCGRYDCGLGLQLVYRPASKNGSRTACKCRRPILSASLSTGPPALKKPSTRSTTKPAALSLFSIRRNGLLSITTGIFPCRSTADSRERFWMTGPCRASFSSRAASRFAFRLEDDNELISSLFFLGAGAPQFTGPLHILNPKNNGNFYLNPTQFSDPTPGTFATTPRSICCGPGENQWDVTFSKEISLSEAKYFQFRADIFNSVQQDSICKSRMETSATRPSARCCRRATRVKCSSL